RHVGPQISRGKIWFAGPALFRPRGLRNARRQCGAARSKATPGHALLECAGRRGRQPRFYFKTTMMKTNALLLLTTFATLGAHAADSAPEADRKAILAMAGKYKVHFHFQETLAFQPGYELTKPVDEDAHEWVVVAVDTPCRIELQH